MKNITLVLTPKEADAVLASIENMTESLETDGNSVDAPIIRRLKAVKARGWGIPGSREAQARQDKATAWAARQEVKALAWAARHPEAALACPGCLHPVGGHDARRVNEFSGCRAHKADGFICTCTRTRGEALRDARSDGKRRAAVSRAQAGS